MRPNTSFLPPFPSFTLSLFLTLSLTLFLTTSCGRQAKRGGGTSGADTIALAACPRFSPDTAMAYVETQCQFGPRIPGTEAWRQCGAWIEGRFNAMGLTVERQVTEVTLYDGTPTPCLNLIARLNPGESDRILLCAHWDTRPWADADPDERNHHTPILGANDGASGVAVLMEMARVMTSDPTSLTGMGVDFVLFDVEDAGTPRWAERDDEEETTPTWCLGSTYWATQASASGYRARYGVLLDMVGGRGSTFSMEGVSRQYASPIVEMLWHLAAQIGYGQFFPLQNGGYVTDDHVAVNTIAQVPCVDIIPYHREGPSSFGPTWHTLSDTPSNIDPAVMEAVGQTVLQLVYNDNQ